VLALQLLCGVLVTVQAQLGIVEKIRAEFQKEGAEVLIDAIEVK